MHHNDKKDNRGTAVRADDNTSSQTTTIDLTVKSTSSPSSVQRPTGLSRADRNINIIIRCASCGVYKYEHIGHRPRRAIYLCRACAMSALPMSSDRRSSTVSCHVDEPGTSAAITARLDALEAHAVAAVRDIQPPPAPDQTLLARITALELAEARRQRVAEIASVSAAAAATLTPSMRSSTVDARWHAIELIIHEQNSIIASLQARVEELECQQNSNHVMTAPAYELPPSMGWMPPTTPWLIPPDNSGPEPPRQ